MQNIPKWMFYSSITECCFNYNVETRQKILIRNCIFVFYINKNDIADFVVNYSAAVCAN